MIGNEGPPTPKVPGVLGETASEGTLAKAADKAKEVKDLAMGKAKEVKDFAVDRAKDFAVDRAREVKDFAADKATQAKDFAVDRFEDVREVAEQTNEDFVAFVKARPVESLLIGLGVGYLLGWLAGKATNRWTKDR